MAKWVKSRPCKQATLSSDPWHAQKSQVFTALGVEIGGSQGTSVSQSSQPTSSQFSRRLSFKN